MYKPRRFDAEELFPMAVIDERGERVWELMDERLLITMDCLSDDWGPVWCNNYAIGGTFDSCGYRMPDDETGAKYSMHKLGKAADPHFVTVTVADYVKWLAAHPTRVKNMDMCLKAVAWAKTKGITLVVDMIREWILAHPGMYPYIKCIEKRSGWMHIDTRNCEPIKVITG